MAFVNDMVNLTNPSPQCFSLPKPLIFYVFKFSKLLCSQKLMKSCKTFKLMHLKIDESQVIDFTVLQKSLMFDIGFSCIKYGSCEYEAEPGTNSFGPKINFQVKSLKVLNKLIFSLFHENKFAILMPKLDLSLTQTICVHVVFQIKHNFMEMLLPASLKHLNLSLIPQFYVNPAILAFQRCLNADTIQISNALDDGKELITKTDLKKIFRIQRKSKLKGTSLSKLATFDPIDILKFMDNHMETNGLLSLRFKDEYLEEYLKLKSYIENIANERKQKGTPMARVLLFCRENKWYHKI